MWLVHSDGVSISWWEDGETRHVTYMQGDQIAEVSNVKLSRALDNLAQIPNSGVTNSER